MISVPISSRIFSRGNAFPAVPLFVNTLLMALVLIGLAGCQWQPLPEQGEISLPLTEQRQFRHLQLENGLKVLLISVPGADKAAASLDVHVGSGDDPEAFQGLAHFLEHMLFLGTAKYPEAGEYQAFITANGGSHNAYTSFEHTNYFFDVVPDALEPALDRFAQFFIAPLFNADFVRREVKAVDSEYRARIRNEGRRELAVFKSQLNPAHPFKKFSVGNLHTLQADNEAALRQALLDFHAEHYSANIMTLTVAGKQSLKDLETMVRARFSQLENRGFVDAPVTEPLFASADKPALPRWINIKPLKQQRSLSVQFPVADASPHWQTKPLSYLGNLLGHEGRGSLLSELKSRGWVESLSAGQSLDYHGGAMFGVDVSLTEAGLDHVDDIIELLYADIALIRAQGISQWRFEEQARLARQQFLFRAQPALIHEVVQLSTALQKYPAEQVLEGPYRMTDFDAELIDSYLDALRPNNSYVTLIAPEVETAERDSRYRVEYGLRPLAASLIDRWQQVLNGSQQVDSQLALPAKNAFIAQNFELKGGDSRQPSRLLNEPGFELWLHNDGDFNLPKGRLYVLLESKRVADSPRSRALSRMWLAMVKDQLNELTYPATLAGLDFSLSSSWRGIELSIGGFDEKQAVLLAEIVKVLRSPEWDEARFERLKAQRHRQLENRRARAPYQQLVAELPATMRRNKPDLDKRLLATDRATLPELQQHVNKVLPSLRYRILLDGNFDKGDAVQISAALKASIPQVVESLQRAENSPRPQQEVLRLPRGDYLRKRNMQHDDASLLYYVQAPNLGKHWRVSMGLAAQMMSAEFYHELRTEKQLGYIVNAGVYPVRDLGGLMFLVQSPVLDAEGIQQEIVDWLARWLEQGVSQAAFEEHRETLKQRLEEKPENMWAAADRHWQDLLEGYTGFDSREQLVEALDQLSYDHFLAAIEVVMDATYRRGLYIYGEGRWPDKRPEGQKIRDLSEFKRELPAYLFP